MSESKTFRVGDRIRFLRECADYDMYAVAEPGDCGTITSVDECGAIVELEYPQRLSVELSGIEPVSATDRRSEFLKELQALLRKYGAKIDIDENEPEMPFVTFWVGSDTIFYERLMTEYLDMITADNIMDYDK